VNRSESTARIRREEMRTIFWWTSLEEVKYWENCVDKIILLKWVIKKLYGTAWAAFITLRIGLGTR
jgi:hypothetical protein